MKKILLLILLTIACFSFSSCNEKETAPPLSQTVEKPTKDLKIPESAEIINGQVIKLYDDIALIADINRENTLYIVPINIPIYNGHDLTPGDLVDIGFDGLVLESYPAKLGNPLFYNIVGKDSSLVSLYENIFTDLWKKDEALNSNIQMIALDLSKAENLKEYEKNALLYVIWTSFGIETVEKTYNELLAENYIDEKNMVFEKGILFTIETSEITENSFKFNAKKWRSGLGAYFFSDCIAEKNESSWTYTIGSEMIS